MGISTVVSVFVVVHAVKVDTPVFLVKLDRVRPRVWENYITPGLAGEVISGVIRNTALGSLGWFSLWLLSMLGGVLLSGQSVQNMLVGFLLHVNGLVGGSGLVALIRLKGHHGNIHANTQRTLIGRTSCSYS